MSVGGGPGGIIHSKIHESLTLAALLSGDFGAVAQGTTVDNAGNDAWEFIRGVVWNDDPDSLLFTDSASQNHTYSMGVDWLRKYKKGASEWNSNDSGRYRNPTGRSHYGDLQFLHSMASSLGEQPQETKRKILIWLEVMYKLATGDGVQASTELQHTKIDEFCPVASLPPSWLGFGYLFQKESPFQGLNVQHRALGSIFHVIQDSYAVGHTRRTLLNPEDKISDSEGITYHPS